jgi:hypothetical protein
MHSFGQAGVVSPPALVSLLAALDPANREADFFAVGVFNTPAAEAAEVRGDRPA